MRLIELVFAAALAVLLLSAPRARAEVTLPHILGDHMVLQRGGHARLWGTAAPGEKISVRGNWEKRNSAMTAAGSDGRWQVRLPLPAPGGPYTITIQGRNKIVLHDVLVGEVWLCSGQSNMQMPVGDFGGVYTGVNHWQDELTNADFPDIRLFNEPTVFNYEPQADITADWTLCTAATAKGFSAAGFFFGRELHDKLHMPIGLISAAVGGTPAEAWTSADGLQTLPDFADGLKYLAQQARHGAEAAHVRAAEIADWTVQVEAADGGIANAAPGLDDSSWPSILDPASWTGPLNNYTGYVWFRKFFDLPAAWAGKDLVLDMHYVDDMDFTYVNGVKVGQTIGDNTWLLPRSYTISKSLLVPGQNLVTVRVLNIAGPGAISAPVRIHPADAPADAISLDRDWHYQLGAKLADLPPLRKMTQYNVDSPTVLYNGMIAPVVPFQIRGVIWYQGEANVGRAEQYRRLFPLLIADWRAHWGEGIFPFYFTQIAPFHYDIFGTGGQAAALRDVQRLSLRTPNTGMAVTMDANSTNNIHPPDKQSVGHRLALWALAETYGDTCLVHSGPLFMRMKMEGGRLRLYFDGVGSGLSSGGKPLQYFEVAGPDKKFFPAQAEIDGDTVVVSSPEVPRPVAVRYAWGDTDGSSLSNLEGLPTACFQDEMPGF